MNKKNSLGTRTQPWNKVFITLGYIFLITFILYTPNLFNKRQGLTLYMYADQVLPEVLHNFERDTGIPVYVKHFSTNEELFAKMKIDRGEGYDLITASDYMVELLHKEDLILPLDHSKVDVFSELDKRLLNKFYDPNNQYSVPISWLVYGLGYSKQFFGPSLPYQSWRMIFDPPRNGQGKPNYYITMVDDGREAFFFGSIYAYNGEHSFKPEQIKTITKMLVDQWSWVENYAHSSQAFYLQSGIVPLIVVGSSSMARVLKNNPEFGFCIPQEGSIMAIENLVISRTCTNTEHAYKLLNYLLSKEPMAKSAAYYGDNPANKLAYPRLRELNPQHIALYISDSQFKKFHLLDNELSIEEYSNMWMTVKASHSR
jgi:spermidine/putrescine transport system substrate-binding protein